MEDKVKISWKSIKTNLNKKGKKLVEVMMTNEDFSKKHFFKTNLKKMTMLFLKYVWFYVKFTWLIQN
jgi:hypothetical protein